MEGGDREVPSQVLTLYQQSRLEAEKQVAAWAEVKRGQLAAVNTALRQAGLAPISISEIEAQVEDLKAR